MAKEPPQTIGDMRRKAVVTDDEISEAVEAYLADPRRTIFRFASGHTLDVSAAVEADEKAKEALVKKAAADAHWQKMLRAAVLRSKPSAK